MFVSGDGRYRQSHAPELFLGAYRFTESGRTLVGYVCSTLSESLSLGHESMAFHVPGAPSICIHSVCVSPDYRRKCIGLNLLKEYVRRLEVASHEGGVYERILLITHEELRGFYEKAGFEWVGKSSVVHGARPWFEMKKSFKHSPLRSPHLTPHHSHSHTPVPPAGLWEALQKSATAGRQRKARLLSSFSCGTDDLVDITGEDEDEIAMNNCDLLCPRDGCGSIIVKKGVARLIEQESVQLEPADHHPGHGLAFMPPPPAVIHWWLITPNAMAFENIGFSRPVHPQGSSLTFSLSPLRSYYR